MMPQTQTSTGGSTGEAMTSEDGCTRVTVVSRAEFEQAFDESGYLTLERGANHADAIARGCPSLREARSRYAGAFLDLDRVRRLHVESRLEPLCAFVDRACRASGHSDVAELGWRFAVLGKREVDNGFPHTLGGLICLPGFLVARIARIDERPPSFRPDDAASVDRESIVVTLLHEKLHVFQRLRPGQADVLGREMGYRRAGKRAELPRAVARVTRDNPDIDDYVYSYEPAGGRIPVCMYRSEQPEGLHDCATVFIGDEDAEGAMAVAKYEHPYEHMAYEMSRSIIRSERSRARARARASVPSVRT